MFWNYLLRQNQSMSPEAQLDALTECKHNGICHSSIIQPNSFSHPPGLLKQMQPTIVELLQKELHQYFSFDGARFTKNDDFHHPFPDDKKILEISNRKGMFLNQKGQHNSNIGIAICSRYFLVLKRGNKQYGDNNTQYRNCFQLFIKVEWEKERNSQA